MLPRRTVELPVVAVVRLALSMLAFLAAALMELRINRPMPHSEPTVSQLKALVTDDWLGEAIEGETRAATSRIQTIERALEHNKSKAADLERAMQLQISATVLLAVELAIALGCNWG